MSNFAIAQIDRLVQDAESALGMRVGLPKAHVDTSLLRHLILHYQRLEAENAALKARILAYDAWFDAHAAILANHRIGGDKFVGHGGVIEPTGNLEVRDE